MCRSVIIAVIFSLFVSCVLAEAAPPTRNETATTCNNDTIVVRHRSIMRRCFTKIVELHVNGSAELKPDDCKNASDFGVKLGSYFDSLTKSCNVSLKFDVTNIVKLVDFSLKNNTFKTFYEDKKCFFGAESEISNTCVRERLGFFNITKESKHLSWTRRANVYYDKITCGNSKGVSDCVASMLHQCKHTTSEYVANLFDYARELGNCSQFPPTATVPPPSGKGTNLLDAVPWLTTPVIITLGIGGVVVVAAIITIIIFKCNN